MISLSGILFLVGCHELLNIFWMIRYAVFAQESATIFGDEYIVLNSDTTEIFIGLNLVEVEEFCTVTGCLPVVDEGRDEVNSRPWTGDTEPSCFDGYFIPTAGEFLIDTNSQTPVAATITKGSFELSNSLTAYRGAGQVIPNELAEGKLTTGVNVTAQPEDWTLMRKTLTGADDGTAVTPNVVYGSTKWSFTHSQDANCTLVVTIGNVPWNFEMPEVDPEGAAAEVEFSADNVGIASRTDSPVTIEIVNKVASYAAAD